jgi:RNA polymerase sigma-70 factor (ECF subfamily)
MNAATSAGNNVADLKDVASVLAGDVRAFEGIVRRWQGPLVNMAWRYCRDRGRAEEMAQEAFLRAWRGLSHWRRESSFSTWLFALAANVYRTELKRFPTETLPLEAAPESAGQATQHSELAARLSQDAVHRAVLALPLLFSRDGRGRGGAHAGDAGGNPEGTALKSADALATAFSEAR